MASEWKSIPLSALLSQGRGISYGIVQPGSHQEDGIPIVRVADIRDSRIAATKPLRVAPEIEAAYARTRLRGGELLLTLVGTVGEAAVVPPEMKGWNVARAVAVIPVRESVGAYWVKLALNAPEAREMIYGRLNTTVQATLNLKDVAQLPILLPDEDERERISGVVGTLDRKIELNRRVSETLEAIAQAIFKSWFVDFNPIRAKADSEPPESICRRLGLTPDLLALFPDRFVDSVLGDIPEGWCVTTLGELCERVSMGPFGSDIKTSNFVANGVPVIRGGNLTAGFIDDNFVFLTEAKADELRNANARPDDIAITHRGTLGQVGLIPTNSRYPRYVVSQSQMVLTVKKERTTPRFIYEFLCSPTGQHALLANSSQVGVPAIARATTSVKAIVLLTPPPKILRAFDSVVGPLFYHVSGATRESTTLAVLRDTLLPKLLSGELRVPVEGAA